MSVYHQIRQMLVNMSGHDRMVTIPKIYIELTGDLAESVLLNQIVFYSDKSHRNDGFFYKSYKEWAEEVCLTERQVRHATKKLREKGIIETKVMKANGAPTVHYKLLFDNLVNWIMTKGKNGNLQNVSLVSDKKLETLTDDYTDNTTDNINNNDNACETAFSFYQKNGFGILTPHVGDKIGAWIEDTNEELVILAMQISVENSVPRWSYAESILQDWQSKKIESVEHVIAHEKKRQMQQSAKNNGFFRRGPAKEEVVPEWFDSSQAVEEQTATTEISAQDVDHKREALLAKLAKMRGEGK